MSEEDQIRELLSQYGRSLNVSDAGLAADCYTSDGLFMPTTLPSARGTELRGAYEQIFNTIRLDVEFSIDELVVVSDTSAYALTRSNGTQTIVETGAESAESNREIFIFKKVERSWKIDRYMFNKAE